MKYLITLSMISLLSFKTLAEDGAWYWDTGGNHPGVKEICDAANSKKNFASKDFAAETEKNKKLYLKELLSQKNKAKGTVPEDELKQRFEKSSLFINFMMDWEKSKSDFYSVMCELRKGAKLTDEMKQRAASLCGANFSEMQTRFDQLKEAMERKRFVPTSYIDEWNADHSKEDAIRGKIMEKLAIDDWEFNYFAMVSDKKYQPDQNWPRFWSSAQREQACKPFNGGGDKDLQNAVNVLRGISAVSTATAVTEKETEPAKPEVQQQPSSVPAEEESN